MKNERIIWLDLVKGINMFLIVISHIGAPNIYVRFYTPIFLTSYFFVSGYTWSPKKNFQQYIKAKTRRLIVPMLCLGSINAVLAIRIDRFGGLLIQRCCIWDDLWFIACLFSSLMIFYVIWRLSEYSKNRYFVGGLLSVFVSVGGYFYIKLINYKLPWQFENAMVMTVFIYLGYLYHYLEQRLEKIERKNCLCFLVTLTYIASVMVYDNKVNIHSEKYGLFFLFMISAIIGVYAISLICKNLSLSAMLTKCTCAFQWVGMNTFVYYAFQSKVIKIVKLIAGRLHLDVNSYVGVIVTALVVCALLAIPAYIIKEYLPFLLGNKMKVRS